MSSWTDERVGLLRKLWDDGHSASAIACELGGVTRNAVIGKVHRLGLLGRAKAPPKGHRRRPRVPAQVRLARPPLQSSMALVPAFEQAAPEPELIDDSVIPMGQRCALLELTAETCHWPVGNPASADFFFCGGKTTMGPYCGYHSRVAYQPAGDRRRDRRQAGHGMAA
jgi:GcrA cell cycle regulator